MSSVLIRNKTLPCELKASSLDLASESTLALAQMSLNSLLQSTQQKATSGDIQMLEASLTGKLTNVDADVCHAIDVAATGTIGELTTAVGKIDGTNSRLDSLITSVAAGIPVTFAPATVAKGPVYQGAMTGVQPAGTTSDTLSPSGTLVTIFGSALSLPYGAVTLTVQFSNDNGAWYSSSNTVAISAPGENFEITFWVACPYFRCIVDKDFQLMAFFASR